MNVTLSEIMKAPVLTITRHETAGHAAEMMRTHHVSALPVVGPESAPLGMVTASDLLASHAEATPISNLMSDKPLTVPGSEGPHVAARIMRNHHIHHVMVTDGNRVVGMVSAYDLLQLVEDHRFQMKQAPTPPKKRSNRR
ncbi:MAG: CBS domain-containing protein [Microthrixaceae bacterium]